MAQGTEQFHASAVALDGQGVLILGRSGAGKSTLALSLLALGAQLICDDIVLARVQDGVVVLCCPVAGQGRIEARGVGILNAGPTVQAPLALCVDLDMSEPDRLPPHRTRTVLGQTTPCVHRSEHTGFPAAIAHYLRYGRNA